MSPRIKGILRIGMFLTGTALAIDAVRLLTFPSKAATSTVPHTVITQEQVTDQTGVSRIATLQTRAVRSDGSAVLTLGTANKGSRLVWFASGIEAFNDLDRRAQSSREG
jgi:hypothetical protein